MIDPIKIRAEVLNLAVKNRQVIYGQQATNFHLPKHLNRETKDYDVLTNKPKESAKELVDNLNKKFGDRYEVIPAMHKGTFKVKDKQTGDTVADYTLSKNKPKSWNEVGVRYVNQKYSERKIRKILSDEKYKFRHDKDFDTLRRIKESRRGLI